MKYQKSTKSKTGRKAPKVNDFKDDSVTPVPMRAPYRFSHKFGLKKAEIEDDDVVVVETNKKCEDKNPQENVVKKHKKQNDEEADTEENEIETKDNKEVIKDCETCKFCLDKTKFGGKGKLKKACEMKTKSKKRKQMASNSTPKPAKRITPAPLITPPLRTTRARRNIIS